MNRMHNKLLVIYTLVLCTTMLFSCKYTRNKPQTLKHNIAEKPEDIVFGNENAPVAVFMYASYQCKFCRYFFSRTFPQFKNEYLDEGKIKLVVKLVDFSDNPRVLYAYQAASCISRFGVYDKFHPLLQTNPNVIFSDDFTQLIDDIMADNQEIEQCVLENNDYSYLRNNVKEFRRNNLSGTPTFVMNNHAYNGFISYENFKKLIIKELNIK